MYNIISNWKIVIDEKYGDYCTLTRITSDQYKAEGHVAHLVSYNSSASFYLSSNSQYIVDRINSLFGHELITRLMIKEIPTIIKPRQIETTEKGCSNAIEDEDSDNRELAADELLKKSLLELQRYL
jgi:hypothetical protein